MFSRLMPRETRFFDLFNEHAALVVEGSRELAALVASGEDLERRAHDIKLIENRADTITQGTIALLHKTFITPLDRNDIHQLISRMDDILDLMEDAAQLMFIYDLRGVTAEEKSLAEICVTCAEKVKAAVGMLANMKNAAAILVVCREIDRLESEADHVMRTAMAKLFREEPDVRQLIKLRAVYQTLEAVTDACEDVANIIESIVLENS